MIDRWMDTMNEQGRHESSDNGEDGEEVVMDNNNNGRNGMEWNGE